MIVAAAALAGAGLAVWMWSRGAPNPKDWPAELASVWAELRGEVGEAAAAGRRAAERREAEFDQELEGGPPGDSRHPSHRSPY
jgi:hypothetical protein